MAIHDAYARLTPFERILPSADFADERFPRIEEEAAERAVDLRDPERFPMLMAVGEALRELRGADDDPELIRQHARVLFQSYHFWKEGRPVHLAPTEVVRRAVEWTRGNGDAGDPGDPSSLAGSAAYLQLPQHLVWSRPAPDAAPESVDGIFWSAKGDALSVVAALGLRPDRPGFGVVDLPPAPLGDWSTWMIADMREEGGADFTTSIPGAEIDGLYEIRSAGELLKLLARVYRVAAPGEPGGGSPGRASSHSDSRRGEESPPDPVRPDAPPASTIPYTRLQLRR